MRMPPKLKMSLLHSQLSVSLSLMPSHRPHHFLSLYFILFMKPNLNSYLQTIIPRFFQDQSQLSVPVTPSSSGPHCPPSHPINNPNPNQKTLTPTFHKMTSPPFLTSLQIPISLLVQPLRLRWTRPGLNRTQLCCRHCLTVLIRLPSYCSLFGLRSILGFNLLQCSSTQ